MIEEHDQPSAKQILSIVAQFIRTEVVPRLQGQTQFHAVVAANSIDIVIRELAFSGETLESETERLRQLLGRDGDWAELNAELCQAIAADEMNIATPGLIQHLKVTTMDRLKVDQPKYAAYRRELDTENAAKAARARRNPS